MSILGIFGSFGKNDNIGNILEVWIGVGRGEDGVEGEEVGMKDTKLRGSELNSRK